eukprot:23168-Pyramimonas_sp.AAC.1
MPLPVWGRVWGSPRGAAVSGAPPGRGRCPGAQAPSHRLLARRGACKHCGSRRLSCPVSCALRGWRARLRLALAQ